MLQPSEEVRAELEMLETALLDCNDSSIQEVIKDWIVEAKQRIKQETRESTPRNFKRLD
jgi:hypothetical protein